MLREIRNVQQRPGEPCRRWFHGSTQDLYVWTEDDGRIVAFEFCYPDGKDERAVLWKRDQGVAYFSVDRGESSALANRTPILGQTRTPNVERVRTYFLAVAEHLPDEVAKVVLENLAKS